MQQVRLTRTDVRIGEGLVDLQRFCLDPLTILIVEALLGNLTDIDLRVEVRGEGVVMVTCVAVHDVEIVDLVEVVLGGIGGIDAAHAWVETAAEDGGQTSLLETVLIRPLPGILKVRLVLRLIVGGVEIVAAACQTGIHDRQILIRQGEVDHEVWLVTVEEGLQLLHVICIHLGGLDVHLISTIVDIIHNLIALRFAARCDHKVGKHISILGNLECCYRCDAPGANH